jgi:DNA-binding transcriptional ArsR family regulator
VGTPNKIAGLLTEDKGSDSGLVPNQLPRISEIARQRRSFHQVNGPWFATDGMRRLVENDRVLSLARRLCFTITFMAASKVAIKRNLEIYERQARICKAFAHPGRLQILDVLGQGERGVSELQEALGISKTRMSQHVSILKSAGVLATRREGKQIYCSLAMPEVKQACQLIRKVLQAQTAASHRLGA